MAERNILQNYLDDAVKRFAILRKDAEAAAHQVSDEEFFFTPDKESNSIAVIMKHVAGNIISRWTDFLTSDGEKASRNRDDEFTIPHGAHRSEIMKHWNDAWEHLFLELGKLSPSDLGRIVFVRAQPLTVVEAINRQMTHHASHVGQIVYLAKHLRGGAWKTLSIPRGKSDEFNRQLGMSKSQ